MAEGLNRVVTACKGSSTCAVTECKCRSRQGDRFTMCRCCEARLTEREREARSGSGWVDIHCKLGMPLGRNMFDYWEAFNREMLLIVGSQLAEEQGRPTASPIRIGGGRGHV